MFEEMQRKAKSTSLVKARKTLSILTGSALALTLLVKFVYKLTTGVYKADQDMTGKTVLITGGNRGIGYETAKGLAGRNARVILACRDIHSGERAAEEIRNSTSNDNVVVRKLDLSSFKSVRSFARGILNSEDRLDVLINNAAIVGLQERQFSEDGVELHYATNHFGPFLLTLLLLPLLKKSAPSRIIVVSSILHFWGKIDMQDIKGVSESYGPVKMYSNTKLANLLFTSELSRRLEGTGVTVNAVHPGNTETGIAGNLPAWILFFGPLVKKLVIKSVQEGAMTSLYASMSPELENVSGKYFADCGPATPSPVMHNQGLAGLLWDLSVKITGWKDGYNYETIVTHREMRQSIGSRGH